MDITNKNFKDALRQNFITLLDSKRGLQAELARAIEKKPSYFSEIKRGNPVNAYHLRAVGIVFGPHKVNELLGITNIDVADRVSLSEQESPSSKPPIGNAIKIYNNVLKRTGLELDAEGQEKLFKLIQDMLVEEAETEETENSLVNSISIASHKVDDA